MRGAIGGASAGFGHDAARGVGLDGPATPAAGRYSSSVYSWSIRVVEKRHSAVAIARRMTLSQRGGRPSASRS